MPLQIILLSFEGGTHIFQERKMKLREVRGMVSDRAWNQVWISLKTSSKSERT